ncbi:xanthine dehydrogenase family protein molybdopterin-binding subunit [Alteromonas sp. Mac1]|uniref:xanthine dehydrogenase family protein molybdopterin-binding subunit n=1 Tax=Alteromonas sp. Mac1 TaxID=1777491 RepID=UPI00076FEA10|nr:molybdopterin cofactor-binding domain-containing protein [Alteromonas sp. Mac1]AMJ86338.1 twin-arginine translocation pathway signal protein [Alteromonas sp. Mac1]AMJ90198.1 twin-arginine translocation pathway signal protein [Alteromonas sp. Mac2]
MSKYFDLTRRSFLKSSATAGALVLGTYFMGTAPRAMAGVLEKPSESAKMANLFVSLRPDGIVEITCHRSEMGQQIRTALAQIVADEMEASWDKVVVIQGKGDPKYGDQNTDGSRSIRYNMQRLREMGASVRHLMQQAAATRWDVPFDSCSAVQHVVTHTSGKTLTYAELVDDALKITPPELDRITLKERSEWRYINTAMAHIDLKDIVTGKATFAADVLEPKALIAVVVRPPVVGGKVKSFDAKAVKAIDGVVDVVEIPAAKGAPQFQPKGGIAIIANNTWAAIKGRRALTVSWDDGKNGDYNSEAFKASLLETVSTPQKSVRAKGDAANVLANASDKLVADYYVPHLAQAPMEPPCATAMYYKDRVDVWAATQNPQADMETVGAMVGMPKEKINVHVTMLGGGFGRKSKPDFSAEAAYLSMKTGKPIRVQWTREDDIQHGFYHAVSAQHIEASLDENGGIDAYLHRTAFSPIASTFQQDATAPFSFELRLGFTDNPINTPNMKLESGEAPAKARIGWMRSVSNIFHAFAIQSFIAEAAHKAGRDQKDYLLETIGPDRIVDVTEQNAEYDNYGADKDAYPLDIGRLRKAIEKVADMSGWGRELPKGRGLGIAAHRSFLTYVATVVEVEVSDAGDLKIIKSWASIDAGTVVNTDTVKNQVQGGSIFGITAAISDGITFDKGRAQQSNFHDYRVPRMSDAPIEIDVEIIPSDAPPAGVGEPATPVYAPALCNAIFAACGKRIRQLPIGNQLKA